MIVLGIETSCDETASAICKDGKILSSITSTQQIHEKYGGVVPEIASREHDKLFNQMVFDTINDSKISSGKIDKKAQEYPPEIQDFLKTAEKIQKETFLEQMKLDNNRLFLSRKFQIKDLLEESTLKTVSIILNAHGLKIPYGNQDISNKKTTA